MIIVGCSHGKHISYRIAKKLKQRHSQLITGKFPDGELHIRLGANVKNKTVVLVQSFYGNISDCIVEAVLASQTAR